MSSNLTIALIERDRANPTSAAHRSLRALQATRVAVSRQAQFAAEPIPLTGGMRPAGAHHPREMCEAAAAGRACASSGKAEEPYQPHRMVQENVCDTRYLAAPYYAASVFEPKIDLYA